MDLGSAPTGVERRPNPRVARAGALTREKEHHAAGMMLFLNWASGIRTHECRSQSPVPYRLAIAHYLYDQQAAAFWATLLVLYIFYKQLIASHFVLIKKSLLCSLNNKDNKVDTGIRTQGLQSHNLAR